MFPKPVFKSRLRYSINAHFSIKTENFFSNAYFEEHRNRKAEKSGLAFGVGAEPILTHGGEQLALPLMRDTANEKLEKLNAALRDVPSPPDRFGFSERPVRRLPLNRDANAHSPIERNSAPDCPFFIL